MIPPAPTACACPLEGARPAPAPARTLAVVACGALGAQVLAAARASGRRIEVHPLSASLHNRPASIASEVEKLCLRLRAEGKEVVVAYADCGTYGALDDVCARLRVRRLPGLHCFDLLAGRAELARLFDEEPGTYLLTDFLVASFDHLVTRELGLDRHPELVADFFGHYRRAVWLTERPTPALEARARRIANTLGLELEVRPVGSRLDGALVRLFASGPRHADRRSPPSGEEYR